MIGASAPSKYLAQLQGDAQVKLDTTAMDAILKSHVIDPAAAGRRVQRVLGRAEGCAARHRRARNEQAVGRVGVCR
jgi:hypothetical protein